MKLNRKYILLMTSVVMIFTAVFFATFQQFIIPWHEETLVRKSWEVAYQLRTMTPYLSSDETQKMVEDMITKSPDLSFILLCDKEGRAFVHSNPDRVGMLFNDEGTLRAAKDGKELEQIYIRDMADPTSSYHGERVIDILIPNFDSNGNHIGAVNVGLSLKSVDKAAGRYYSFLVMMLVIVVILIVLISTKLFNEIIIPINRLVSAIKSFKQTGKYHKVKNDSKDEIGLLTDEFNVMGKDISDLVTQLKNAKEELKEYIDKLITFTAKITPEGNVLLINERALKAGSLSTEQIINVKFWDLSYWRFSEEAREEFIANFRKAISEKRVVRYDGINFLNAKLTYLDIIINPVFDEKEEIKYLIVEGRDISQIKETQVALMESEIKYRTLVENLPQKIYIKDVNQKYISCNEKFARSLNKAPDKITGLTDFDLLSEELATQYTAEDDYVLKSGEMVEFEDVMTVAGKTIPIQKVKLPVRNETGEITGMLGVFWDISKRKKAEGDVVKLSRALKQSPASVAIADLEGNIEFVNAAFTKITGYEYEDLPTNNLSLFDLFDKSINLKEVAKIVRTGHDWIEELLFVRKDSAKIWAYNILTVLKNERNEVTHLFLIQEDITESKLVESELIRAKEKAEESDKLKSDFLAQMSHEIRTPINTILSFTSLLKMELEDSLPIELADTFKMIENGGKRLIRTIDLLLNMSQVQTGSYEPKITKIDMCHDVMKPLVSEFRVIADNRGIELIVNKQTEETFINVDKYTVTQVFSNLLDNALKYTHEGSVKLSIERVNNKKLRIKVEDTGIGISEEYLPNLFSPFSQEMTGYTRKFEGNGLGLALVKKYCELNNASISVESKKNVGSTFEVVFNS